MGGPGARRSGRGAGGGLCFAGPFPALSSPVGPGAGGHRRELGFFLLLLPGGQWGGVGDSHAGPACLVQEQLPMVKPWHVGSEMSWEGSKNPAGVEAAASIPREAPTFFPAAGGQRVPSAEKPLGLLHAATGGPVVPGEWHVPMAGTSPFESSVCAGHMVSLSPPTPSSGWGDLGDPDAQSLDVKRAGE